MKKVLGYIERGRKEGAQILGLAAIAPRAVG